MRPSPPTTEITFGAYYHVSCLEAMIELPQLAASRFMLDTEPYRWNHNAPWGWVLCSGIGSSTSERVNLPNVATYFEMMGPSWNNKTIGGWSTRYIDWQIVHGECRADCGLSGRIQEPPNPPERPNIEDYTREDGSNSKACPLSDVLNHKDSWRQVLA